MTNSKVSAVNIVAYPGEIIGGGTVDDGCGLERCEFLADGDEVVLTVDGLGTLRNWVVAPHIG